MKYRKDRQGNLLSVLGFGCMRFTKKNGKIDLEKAETEILEGIRLGINYFDTAYVYTGSEAALGEILEKNHLRDQVKIATKLPQYLVGNYEALDRFFAEELHRLRTDYIDYYLIHHLTDVGMWEKLKETGIQRWIAEKKQTGAIRQIGFSYHGNSDGFLKILEDYDWDLCQIQYNYLDENTQAGRVGLKAASARGIPVVIMEPLRGGKLVSMLPKEAQNIFQESETKRSPAEWSFHWLWDQPEVTVVLSGMNSVAMVRENCSYADEARSGSFTEEDRQILQKAVLSIREGEVVGCTGCRYCMPCPKGVDIPGLFRCWNAMKTEGKWDGRFQYAQTVGLTKESAFASQCIGCGKCEKHCPQNLPIRELLKKADRAVRPIPMRIGIAAARKYMFRKRKGKKENE